MKVISIITDYETKKILKHLGIWNIRSHSPPPIRNFHPPPAKDFILDEKSYFQEFIPPDDVYVVDQFFSLDLKKIRKKDKGLARPTKNID